LKFLFKVFSFGLCGRSISGSTEEDKNGREKKRNSTTSSSDFPLQAHNNGMFGSATSPSPLTGNVLPPQSCSEHPLVVNYTTKNPF
jgi:hypothetical protein